MNKTMEFQPLVFDLNKLDEYKYEKVKFDSEFTNNIAYPEMKLGFHHFIHQFYDKLKSTNEYKDRKKIYLVTNPFEFNIDHKNETEDSLPFTSIINGVDKLSKSIDKSLEPFYSDNSCKLWEIIVNFDLIDDSKDFTSFHINENSCSFVQAINTYRKYIKDDKPLTNDKYYVDTLITYPDLSSKQDEFIKNTIKSNGNLTINKKSSSKHKVLFGGKGDINANLITADGHLDDNVKIVIEEQASEILILEEIQQALNNQDNGGHFVLKIFETFCTNTIKIIEMLRYLYKQIYIYKPFTSRMSNPEKFLVCKDFNKKLYNSDFNTKLEKLISNINKNKEYNILELFSEIKLSSKSYDYYKNMNNILSVKQYDAVNAIMKFINLDNKNGVEYNNYLDTQIKAAHYWNKSYADINDLDKTRKYVSSFNPIKFYDDVNKDEINKTETTVDDIPVNMQIPNESGIDPEIIPPSPIKETKTKKETKSKSKSKTKTKK